MKNYYQKNKLNKKLKEKKKKELQEMVKNIG